MDEPSRPGRLPWASLTLFLVLGGALILASLGCPSQGPSGPGAPTATPTETATPTPTCPGGGSLGDSGALSAASLIGPSNTELFASPAVAPSTANLVGLNATFYNSRKDDVIFALYDDSGNKLAESGQGKLPSWSGWDDTYGLPMTPYPLSAGVTYWIAVMVRNNSTDPYEGGVQWAQNDGGGFARSVTFGVFPDPLNIPVSTGTFSLWGDTCP